MTYTKNFPIQFNPVADPNAVIEDLNVRFTVLTSRLLRLEYSPENRFEDRPSQPFWYRQQPVPALETRRDGVGLVIETADLTLYYWPNEAGFTADTLSIELKANGVRYQYGDANPDNLQGTARTVDDVDGAVQLEQGLLSRSGWALVDDSDTLVFNDEGWLELREAAAGTLDLYFFGYGQEYEQCLHDYQLLTGKAPLLPRWVLGNWWSRFWPYSDKDLLGLMDEFRTNGVPLSVCIVDIDWHLRETGNKSTGWTGYTWNRELFPDPTGFIGKLHERGLKTGFNLHPAEGIHPHEEQYEAMATHMGIDPKTQEPVEFDCVDPHFMKAYFEMLHHPDERRGVDFWWIDWQQGDKSKIPSLDPLWWLNHLHFYDLGRDNPSRNGNKRPFIFSRWGGLGNHRYPIGFSGDSIVTWESLAFQPYFTATAANVAYGWWSHDIGGHMGGFEEAELYARWVQYGVFSPIFRLHCTNNPFHERRPWGYDAETFRVTKRAMRLRHQLIPYLYTMSWRNRENGRSPITPLYHDYPNAEPAYHCQDQYMFGSELLAAPFISRREEGLGLSKQVVWLPDGDWHHFFDGTFYGGNRWHALYGALDDIPVFAKPGAIVPLGADSGWGGVDNPETLEIHFFPGADNRFDLFEDDGGDSYSLTPLRQSWSETRWHVNIDRLRGTAGHLPAERNYTLCFRGVAPDARLRLLVNGQIMSIKPKYEADTVTLKVSGIKLTPLSSLTAVLTTKSESLLAHKDYRLATCRQMLWSFRMDSWVKQAINDRLPEILDNPGLLANWELSLSERQLQAISEVVFGAGVFEGQQRDTGRPFTLLWNNQQRDDVTYKFVGKASNQGVSPSAGSDTTVQRGQLPSFAAITTDGELAHWQTGHSDGAQFETVGHWFDTLPQRFDETAVGALEATVQFLIQDESDQQKGQTSYIQIRQGKLDVRQGLHPRPTISLTANASDFLALANGDAQPIELFQSQRLRVGGNFVLIGPIINALGTIPQNRFSASPWKLRINYADLLTVNLASKR
ncbi:MAG: TIM-barrel domain-containing protein [Chloroflexota bacterium]